jgi:hypothetical protein
MSRWKPIAGLLLALLVVAGSVFWFCKEQQASRLRAEEEARVLREKAAARQAEEDAPEKSYRQLVGEMAM